MADIRCQKQNKQTNNPTNKQTKTKTKQNKNKKNKTKKQWNAKEI